MNYVWRLREYTTVDEINLYYKRLQFVNNLIAESSRDIIICSTVCSVLVVLQYLFGTMVYRTDSIISSFGMQMIGFKFPTLGLAVYPLFSQNYTGNASTAWDAGYYLMLFLVKIYMMRLYDISEYDDDLCKAYTR